MWSQSHLHKLFLQATSQREWQVIEAEPEVEEAIVTVKPERVNQVSVSSVVSSECKRKIEFVMYNVVLCRNEMN